MSAKSPQPVQHGAKSPVPLVAGPPKLTRQLSTHSARVLEAAFAQLDTTRSGSIGVADAKRYFESVVKACNATESAAMMMAEFDENGDTKISFDEWAAFFKRIQVPEQTLEAVLTGMGFGAPSPSASASASAASPVPIATAAGVDAKSPSAGAAAAAKSPTPARLASPLPPPPALVRQLSSHSTRVLETAFAKLDTTKSGVITASDARQYFERVVKACNATESAAMMMAEFDENGDAKISFDEWAAFFKRIQVPERTLESVLSGMGF